MIKCPNKSSEQYKELLEIANGNDLLANYMWRTLDYLKDKGFVTKTRMKLYNGKYAYTIPKLVNEKSLSKKPSGWDKDLGKKQALEKLLEEADINWIEINERDNAFLLKITEPVLKEMLPVEKQFDISEEVEKMSQLMFEEDYKLSEQALKEQELAEDKERKLANKKEDNIKPGVQELFESNPELANSVYEALGFKQSNLEAAARVKKAEEDVKQIHKIGIDTEYEDVVKNQDKNRFHFLDTNDFKNTNQKSVNIEHIHVPEKYRNKGYGLSLYIVRGEELLKEGKYLISYDQHSPEAEIVWQRLLQLGLATQSGEYGTYQYVGLKGQITPQQKQQALQLYSQYLDTIFPDSKVKDIVYHGTEDKFDKFDIKFFGKNDYGDLGKGFYFAFDKSDVFNEPIIVSAVVDDTNSKQNKGYEIMIPNAEQIHILGSKQDIEGFKEFVKQPVKQQGQLSLFTEEDFNQKFPNFAELQPFEKKIINDNKDEDLDIQCKL